MPATIKVMLIEDHAGYREVITRTLGSTSELKLIDQFGTAEIALREIEKLTENEAPDVLLLDLNLPGVSGLEAIPWFKQYSAKSKIIVLTQSDKESDVLTAISLGASGYLLKSATAQQIKDAIKIVFKGGASLDPSVAQFILNKLRTRPTENQLEKALSGRELEILSLLGEGMVKKEIANHLNIGVTTVAYHIKHIYQKLQVQNAPAAVAKGYRKGLL
ncbi:MAG: response regulator [Roseibacillus sp.]